MFLQDDNRVPRTPDLRIEAPDGLVRVGEVVTATEGGRAALLGAFASGELEFEDSRLCCKWWVTVSPAANRRRLRDAMVPLLVDLEASGERHPTLVPIEPGLASPVVRALHKLGISELACDDRPGSGVGVVVGLVEGVGGPTTLDWAGFHAWVDGFLSSPSAVKKRQKLVGAAGAMAVERHLFVGIPWSVPWAVLRVLERDVAEVPTRAPALPAGVTHLWLFGAELPGRCLAWWPDRGWFDVSTRWATE